MTSRQSNDAYVPSVSIVLPVYNAMRTLALCLESIKNLEYHGDRLEMIIVDNGSTDGSYKFISQFRFPFAVTILQETSGQSSYIARNSGIKTAKGEIIAFTDANCIVSPKWLKYLIRDFGDEHVGCFAGEIFGYQPTTILEKFSDRSGELRQKTAVDAKNLPFPYAQTGNVAYRKNVFGQIGLFLPVESGGDAEMSLRMQKKTGLGIKFVPEAIVYYQYRSTIAGLYRQYKKYECGQIILQQYHPEFQVSTLGQRVNELGLSINDSLISLPRDIYRYLTGKIDIVEFWAKSLRTIISLARVAAHLEMRNKIKTAVSGK